MPQADLDIIQTAKQALETELLAMKISNFAGKPVDMLQSALPEKYKHQISNRLNVSLEKACERAVLTVGPGQSPILRKNRMHKAAVILTGFWGGFGGLATTLVELAVSTLLMLRSVERLCLKHGEAAVKAACKSLPGLHEKTDGKEVDPRIKRINADG